MDLKLEVVVLPVSDVDRAKQFYDSLGWRLDADVSTGEDFRVIQLTPPGSPASIIFGTGIAEPGAGPVTGLHLAVSDIDSARDELVGAGVDVSEVFHDAGGVFHHGGIDGRVSGPDPEGHSYASFATFTDPDGNRWWLQEITTRLPGRVENATTFSSADELAAALRRAADAHGEHETRLGTADPDWPDWYAVYLIAEYTGSELPK
ncbi:MAG: VOC family protein [Mycobacterium sp.]|nr:VOC family protein [Mycobacterium sp.]